MGRVPFYEFRELAGYVLVPENRFDRTFLDALIAVDTYLRIDIKHLRRCEIRFMLGRMDAVNRADHNARGVFHANAGFGNHISHFASE
jgi:hypothetical protein